MYLYEYEVVMEETTYRCAFMIALLYFLIDSTFYGTLIGHMRKKKWIIDGVALCEHHNLAKNGHQFDLEQGLSRAPIRPQSMSAYKCDTSHFLKRHRLGSSMPPSVISIAS